LTSRLAGYARTVRALRRGGVRWSDILLFPIRRRLPHGTKTITLKCGLRLTAPISEPLLHIFEEIFVDQCYALEGLQLPRGATIIDIGAHVGLFSLWITRQAPDARAICVEPSPGLHSFLRRNITENRLPNVHVLEAACASPGPARALYGRGPNAMNTLFARDALGSTFHQVACTARVSLDEIFERYGIVRCDFLKMDCEGAEYEVLFGASQATIAGIRALAMEYHVGLNDHDPEDMVRFLNSEGFAVRKMPLSQDDPETGYLYAQRTC